MKHKVLLTGGAGFIGSVMLHTLNQRGVTEVLVVDNLGSDEKWKNLRGKLFIDCIPAKELLERIALGTLDAPQSIIHMGACSSTFEQNAEYLFANNFRYSVTLAEYALRIGARMVYASSGATYGGGECGYDDTKSNFEKFRPLNPYGFSKLLFDQWVVRQGFESKLCGLKFFNVYGPNEYHKGEMQSVIRKAYRQVCDLGEIRLFKSYRADFRNGEQKRDFVYVRDVVATMSWLLDHPEVNGIFNVGSGQARSWNDVAHAVFTAMGRDPKIEYIEMPDNLRRQYQYYTEAPMQKLASTGCVIPGTSLEDGVKDYVTQFLQREEQHL